MIGIVHDGAFDPDDRINRDRRGENDGLAGGSFDDHNLFMIRVDAADGSPIAMLPIFGIHGTIQGEDNNLSSTDAPGATCTATFSVRDAQGRVTNAERDGRLLLDLLGYPKAPASIKQSGYADGSLTVRIDPGSDPASGSVRPKQPISSPRARAGRYFAFCSSEP